MMKKKSETVGMKKKSKKLLGILLTMIIPLVLAVCFLPAAVYAADDSNPELLQTPGVYDDANRATEALKEQIEALNKIIKLNVEEAEDIPVLLYHHVVNEKDMTSEQKNNGSIISTELFTAHMKYLYDNKYYTATLRELEQFIAGKIMLPKKTVVITFDDGYRSNTRYCYPVLKKYDFKASIFLITSLIGAKENVIEHASWNDLNRCADVFSYYSHSHDMHKTDKEGRSVLLTSSLSNVKKDLLTSRAIIDAGYFAYPYGQNNQRAIEALKQTGYRMAFTTEAGYVKKRANTYTLPRFAISSVTSVESIESIVSGVATNVTDASDADEESEAGAAATGT